jgi:hypothetical protein
MRFRNALGRAHAAMVPPQLLVMERMNGLVEAKVITLIAERGIPDLLANGPRTAEELARDASVDADALDRALAFLVSRGLLGRTRDGRYENNAVSDVLRTDHPQSMRDWARFFASDWHWAMWNAAGHSLATGRDAPREALGAEFWEYLNERNPEAGATFNAALAGTSLIAGPILAKGYDFSGIRRLCDVGGGTGGVLAALLHAYPSMRGVLFDLPTVIEQARPRLAAWGDRVELVGGSFFDAVPAGCDAYLMQAVIHDWDDESCVTILTRCREALSPDGRVLVVENVLNPIPSSADQFARSFDLVMLVTSGLGRERTRPQFDALFARARLRVRDDVVLPSLFHVLELIPNG